MTLRTMRDGLMWLMILPGVIIFWAVSFMMIAVRLALCYRKDMVGYERNKLWESVIIEAEVKNQEYHKSLRL